MSVFRRPQPASPKDLSCTCCPQIQEYHFWLKLWPSVLERYTCLLSCLCFYLLEGPQPPIGGTFSPGQTLACPQPYLQPCLLLLLTVLPGWSPALLHCLGLPTKPAPSSALCTSPMGLCPTSEDTGSTGVTLNSQLINPRWRTPLLLPGRCWPITPSTEGSLYTLYTFLSTCTSWSMTKSLF